MGRAQYPSLEPLSPQDPAEDDIYGSCLVAELLSDDEDEEEEGLDTYGTFDNLLVTYRVAMKWLGAARGVEQDQTSPLPEDADDELLKMRTRGVSRIDLGDSC